MADPFSLVVGVTGLVKAASDVSVVLAKLIRGVKDAPALAQAALKEVMDMSPIFQQLQYFILNLDKTDSTRKSQLGVDQVLILVSSCVETYSDLNRLLQDIAPTDMNMFDRLKWVNRGADVSSMINRLQTHKASLGLLLQVFVGSNIVEVKEAINGLRSELNRFYRDWSAGTSSDSEQLCSHLVEPSEMSYFNDLAIDEEEESENEASHDGASSVTLTKSSKTLAHSLCPSTSYFYDFDADLMSSRPYKHIRLNDYSSVISLGDSKDVALSTVTGISLDDISDASFFNLLISRDGLSNPQHYQDVMSRRYKILLVTARILYLWFHAHSL